ncbi:MAG: hypothetical protein ACLUG4_02270 [Bacilli bacterium]|jgi:hypothetical protein|nr:hypothetical protein [Staphylococcus sp.]
MKTLVKGCFMMFMMLFTYLDVMSCRPIYNNIVIYNYDGSKFSLQQEEKLSRYSDYYYSQYDEMFLEGYTFLGWISTNHSFETIDDILALEIDKTFLELSEKIEGTSYTSIKYYPLFIENEKLDTFLQTSELAKVKIEVITIQDGSIGEREEYVTTLFETYESSINAPKELAGYQFIGYSKKRVEYDDYKTDGLNEDIKLNIKSKIEKSRSIVIYAYYQSI